jgi:hypothetical protein
VSDLPDDGVTLVVGPANVGKTRRTAAAIDAWIAEHGPDGVAVLDFAPEVERDGRLLGGRLDRFTTVPDDATSLVLDAHAPRTESDTEDEASALAADNAERAGSLLDDAPADPTAVFVNDATVPFQADGDIERLRAYCADAAVVVANAFESDELGTDDPVSGNERAALADLRSWADRIVELG